MNLHFGRVLLSASVLLAASVGCNKHSSVAGAGSANDTVATFHDQKITLGELDQKIAPRIYELRKQTLDQMVMEKVIQAEAKKRGQTEEQFFKTEVDDKLAPIGDEQLAQVFEQSKGQLPPGSTLEQFKDQIKNYLQQRPKQERLRELYTELRAQAKVEVKLPEPRIEVDKKGPSQGPDNAPITIVEFSDFQCPYCSRASETVHQVMEKYAGKVKLHFRHFPLGFHEKAPKASEAAMCANEQGKFWEYHDALFKNQQKLDVADLKEHAKTVGLDAGNFDGCLDAGKYAQLVKDDTAAGEKAGVTGTPAFFINGIFLSGAQPMEEFTRVIDAELAKK